MRRYLTILSLLTFSPLIFAQGQDIDFHPQEREVAECGVYLYKEMNHKACGVLKHQAGKGPQCGIESNKKILQLREVRTTHEMTQKDHAFEDAELSRYCAAEARNISLSLPSGESDQGSRPDGVSHSRECYDRHVVTNKCQKWDLTVSFDCVTTIGKEVEQIVYQTCEHPDFGTIYNTCRSENFEVERYNTCLIIMTEAELNQYILETEAKLSEYKLEAAKARLNFLLAQDLGDSVSCLMQQWKENGFYKDIFPKLEAALASYPGSLSYPIDYACQDADAEVSDRFDTEKRCTVLEMDTVNKIVDELRAKGEQNSFYDSCLAYHQFREIRHWYQSRLGEIDLLSEDVVAQKSEQYQNTLYQLRKRIKHHSDQQICLFGGCSQ